jgi:pimeloyl-ACP methyl ester carboxylesterase
MEQGDGSGPVLVLLPGPTDSWCSYQQILDRIPLTIRTIAVSQRGHGDSDKPATGYRVEDFTADVVPLLDALEIERAVLAGHSGSCFTVRRVAIDHPERVAGLVLEASPTTLQDHARLKEFVELHVSGLQDPIDPDFVRSIATDTSSSNIEPKLIEQMVSEQLKVPARVWQEIFAELMDYNDMDGISRISAPTLLIWGDADGIVSREMQDKLIESFPCADLVVYPDVGHTPRWENPIRFASDVTAFVERCFPPQF